MVKVKKKGGKLEEFKKSKIVKGVKKTGASAKEAAEVAKDVSKQLAEKAVISAKKLSDMVMNSLKKVNKKAADAFAEFRKKAKK